jgi:single-strand DNA-binding protein
MLNHTVLVGRISNYDEVAKVVTLAVSRSFKNIDGEFETDFIPVKLWNNASPQMELVKIGDIIGIKGRIERTGVELRIVAEKVTFLAQGNKGEITNED